MLTSSKVNSLITLNPRSFNAAPPPSSNRRKSIKVKCAECGSRMLLEPNQIRKKNYCSVPCQHPGQVLYSKGKIAVYFDGVKMQERRFIHRTRLKQLLKEWHETYAGGELRILFDEIKT